MRRTFGIRARLMMLAVVTTLPLVGLGSFFILRMVEDQREQIKQDVSHRVENLLWDVDRQISAIEAELQVLAASPSLQDGDFAAFYRQMREALKIRGTSIVLHDTKGQQLLSTNRPFGEPLPRATNTEMHDRVVATLAPDLRSDPRRRPTPAYSGGGGAGFPRRPGHICAGDGARPRGLVVAAP